MVCTFFFFFSSLAALLAKLLGHDRAKEGSAANQKPSIKGSLRALPFIFGRTTTQAENSQKLVELNVARHRESGS